MEPKSSPEAFPQPQNPIEYQAPHSPERPVEVNPEHRESSPERSQERTTQAMPPQSAALPTPVVVPTTPATADDTDVSTDDNPAVAADEDLIEKEWVDKAKKIIADTRDDPYKREQAVGKLQADYLKKRYGKDLGSS